MSMPQHSFISSARPAEKSHRMRTFTAYPEPNELPALFSRGCVAALGNFDGVHRGHAALIAAANEIAARETRLSCVYSFREHTASRGGKVPLLLTLPDEKEALLAARGVDLFMNDDFSAVRVLSCEEFCRDILVGRLHCEVAVCGNDFRFGKDRAGDCETLRCEMEKLGKRVRIVDDVFDDTDPAEQPLPIHSTTIRTLLAAGNVERAASLLGRPYSLSYPVIHGKRFGRTLGFPTINQAPDARKVCPKKGVYACRCTVDGQTLRGVCDIGTKPTVNREPNPQTILCETHILGYSGDLYGKTVTVEFFARLRDEKKFSSTDELKEEIERNKRQTEELFDKLEAQEPKNASDTAVQEPSKTDSNESFRNG